MITTVCKISYGSQTVPPIVPAVQGDTGRAISFEIADFTPPAGATATYFILKPSGEAIYNSATITDNSILCELTAQSLAEAGENRMQVRVLQGEDIVTSFEVILMVRTFLGDDAIESGTEMNIFDQAVEQATEQFQENAEQIVEEVIESIPADYTELTEEVDELNERLDNIEPGLSDEAKAALLACFDGVLWASSEDGETLYDDLYAALYKQKPIKELYYDISKAEFTIGGFAPETVWSNDGTTRTRQWNRMVRKNQLTNRAGLKATFPCTSGTINAEDGYQIVVYELSGIGFVSNHYHHPETSITNVFGLTNGLNINWHSDPNVTPAPPVDTPEWVSSYTIESANCQYVLIGIRKTDNSDWTQEEIERPYGTVFTANIFPKTKISDVATFKGGYSYTEGDTVKDESITEVGFNRTHTRKYVKEIATSARAVSGFLPITNGKLKSADVTKYQLCVYQINIEGQIMWDSSNPYISATNGNPTWANEFDLSISANKDDIFCVCISFKKLDGTEFTQEELSSMYGTVFTYEES